MNIKNLSYTLLKILSVWIFVDSFIPNFIMYITVLLKPFRSYDAFEKNNLLMAAQPALYLILSLLTWFGADKLSSSISKNHSAENAHSDENISIKSSLPENKLIETGLVLIGFYFLANRIPYLLTNLIGLIDSTSNGFNAFLSLRRDGFIQSSITIIIAVYLIIGKSRIVNALSKFRTFGTQKID